MHPQPACFLLHPGRLDEPPVPSMQTWAAHYSRSHASRLRRATMENQPRDESRAATVREGGNESWTEAAEFIDDPSMLPTARASGSFGEASGERPTPSGGFQSTVGQQQTRSPHGSDFSSSAAPVGQGSNTPVGGEPDTFQEWDARQPAPGP